MPEIRFTRKDFLEDRQGRTFADVLNDPEQPLDAVLDFFNDAEHQRRMEESEIHHDRPALAGVVRELESLKSLEQFLGTGSGLSAASITPSAPFGNFKAAASVSSASTPGWASVA